MIRYFPGQPNGRAQWTTRARRLLVKCSGGNRPWTQFNRRARPFFPCHRSEWGRPRRKATFRAEGPSRTTSFREAPDPFELAAIPTQDSPQQQGWRKGAFPEHPQQRAPPKTRIELAHPSATYGEPWRPLRILVTREHHLQEKRRSPWARYLYADCPPTLPGRRPSGFFSGCPTAPRQLIANYSWSTLPFRHAPRPIPWPGCTTRFGFIIQAVSPRQPINIIRRRFQALEQVYLAPGRELNRSISEDGNCVVSLRRPRSPH